jgi:hypothetical protein
MPEPTSHGYRDSYRWISSPNGNMWRLLEAVPDLVMGHVVAVTSFDHGALSPTESEGCAGWTANEGIAWSPEIARLEQLPLAGWDEWYVFDERSELRELEVFVNDAGFHPDPSQPDTDATWCRRLFGEALRQQRERAESFWCQLQRLQPLAYLASGDTLTCVTRDDNLAARVLVALNRLAN